MQFGTDGGSRNAFYISVACGSIDLSVHKRSTARMLPPSTVCAFWTYYWWSSSLINCANLYLHQRSIYGINSKCRLAYSRPHQARLVPYNSSFMSFVLQRKKEINKQKQNHTHHHHYQQQWHAQTHTHTHVKKCYIVFITNQSRVNVSVKHRGNPSRIWVVRLGQIGG